MNFIEKTKEIISWHVYKLLLKIISSVKNNDKDHLGLTKLDDYSCNANEKFTWFFCSTIGELNACSPFINVKYGTEKIVIITDRIFYKTSFLTKYPKAVILDINNADNEMSEYIKKFTPDFFYMCEIPCSPNDAPCRFPYEILRAIKSAASGMFIINGWLYQYEPSCTQDKIERLFFDRSYIRMFDGIAVQTEEIKELLITKGADSSKVEVTGNMKFDALNDNSLNKLDITSEELICKLDLYENVVVAGCLINEAEYEKVIKAFSEVLKELPEAIFVLAPRHPEKKDQLDAIVKLLKKYQISFNSKSKLESASDFNSSVLILDTLGELRNFYSTGRVCYVGRDHNVLEPLFLDKRVIVPDNWHTKYPSYPVFETVLRNGLITLHTENELGCEFLLQLKDKSLDKKDFKSSLKELSGATKRNEEFIKKICTMNGL
ncbi:MAG: 3-deoxy-D-manno-octulosonic acid transferase [Pseudomonadales bacterium]